MADEQIRPERFAAGEDEVLLGAAADVLLARRVLELVRMLDADGGNGEAKATAAIVAVREEWFSQRNQTIDVGTAVELALEYLRDGGTFAFDAVPDSPEDVLRAAGLPLDVFDDEDGGGGAA